MHRNTFDKFELNEAVSKSQKKEIDNTKKMGKELKVRTKKMASEFTKIVNKLADLANDLTDWGDLGLESAFEENKAGLENIIDNLKDAGSEIDKLTKIGIDTIKRVGG